MRIKSVRLRNYKRFTDLRVDEIPESAKLVVLIGPNGSGKSSLFDAFLLKSQEAISNFGLSNKQVDYYVKDTSTADARPQSTGGVRQKIDVSFHGRDLQRDEWAAAFYIRSAYRNEADSQTATLECVKTAAETQRFGRIIDTDATAVSDNYRRLTWQGLKDLFGKGSGKTTFDDYRRKVLGDLQKAMKTLFTHPVLELQDFGGLQDSGTFRFDKGTASDFHYKNLSGGEKAAFDLLLDISVKRDEYQNAIYCIDEPEAHVATALHGRLLETMIGLIPEESQLWIATHSVGFVRKAYEMMQKNNDVVFLDFSGRDFDQKVELTPRATDRTFWKTTYEVALDDLSDLIAPKNIVICEGSRSEIDKGFDADCYNQIFSSTHSDTLFMSRGSSKQVENSEDLIMILERVAKGINVYRLIDRDDMTDDVRKEKIKNGIRVLGRREIENYLYAPEVLETFLKSKEKGDVVEEILDYQSSLLPSGISVSDMKNVTQQVLNRIKRSTHLGHLGNACKEFALQHLVPALKETTSVFQELESDIFS
ncbi:MAG: hypothetical protein M2R45_01949 [Verrucomicrobia subdivision 3 bacterium]|nr:hypothetical protein [Limisphaerales bacterium]MCS1416184.1 hypothetical protein [Limisphaerales bacterium]